MYLKELITIKYGKNQNKVVSNSGYPIYGTSGVIGFSKEYLYNKPSILIGRKGSIDKVQYVDKPFWCVDTTFYSIINEKEVLPKYLYYKLSLINFKQFDEGTTIPSLRTETLKNIELSIHSVIEQQHIVDTIGSIDDLIEKYELLIQKLDKFSGIIYKKISLSRNYSIKKLNEICDIKYGKAIEANKLTNSREYSVYGGNGIIGTLDTYDHSDYKISISCRGAASGNILITEPYSTISSNSLYLNLYDELNFFYVYMYLKKSNLPSIATGSAQPQITISNIVDYEIKLFNNNFNTLFKKFLINKSSIKNKIKKLNLLKQQYLKKFFG